MRTSCMDDGKALMAGLALGLLQSARRGPIARRRLPAQPSGAAKGLSNVHHISTSVGFSASAKIGGVSCLHASLRTENSGGDRPPGFYSDTFFGFLLGVIGVGAQDPVTVAILIVLSFVAAGLASAGVRPFGVEPVDLPPVVAFFTLFMSFVASALFGGAFLGSILDLDIAVRSTVSLITAGACAVAIGGHFVIVRK